MFDLAWSELAVIGVVALVVVGPKDLPKLMRSAGQMAAKARRMADEFRGQVTDAMREADLEDMRKSVNDLRSLNPANMIRDEIAKMAEPVKAIGEDVRSELSTIDRMADNAAQPVAEMPSGEPTIVPAHEASAEPMPLVAPSEAGAAEVAVAAPEPLAGEPYFPEPEPVAAAEPERIAAATPPPADAAVEPASSERKA